MIYPNRTHAIAEGAGHDRARLPQDREGTSSTTCRPAPASAAVHAHEGRDRRRPGHRQEHAGAPARRPLPPRLVRRRRRRACGIRACCRTSRPARNPVGVTAYFGWLYDANYRDAAAHDGPGKVIFFEGARITLEAHIAEYPAAMSRRAAPGAGDWRRLAARPVDRAHLEHRHDREAHPPAQPAARRRGETWCAASASSTPSSGAWRRSIPTRSSSIATAASSTSATGLRHIIDAAGLPPFVEVPYRVMDRYEPRCSSAPRGATTRPGPAPAIGSQGREPRQLPPRLFHRRRPPVPHLRVARRPRAAARASSPATRPCPRASSPSCASRRRAAAARRSRSSTTCRESGVLEGSLRRAEAHVRGRRRRGREHRRSAGRPARAHPPGAAEKGWTVKG